MDKVEALARKMAEDDGWDPNMMVCHGEPVRLLLPTGFAYVPAGKPYPLWTTFVRIAEVALGFVDRTNASPDATVT